jgi:hypothetical protein
LITTGLTPLGLLIVSCFSGKGTTLFGTPKTRYFDKICSLSINRIKSKIKQHAPEKINQVKISENKLIIPSVNF